jgi:hypothetical protein
MEGSDIDNMYIVRTVRVYEDINKVPFNSSETSFVMDMDDCKLGFTHLRMVHCIHPTILQLCRQIGNSYYFSNELLKTIILTKLSKHGEYQRVHGPCLTDEYGTFDDAICLHSREWISPTNKWLKRSNSSWPSSELKSKIIDHGILFVPIGCKDSKNEDIEWRFSFSVGEKLLIYSFTHVQLICYALMKILLKDVIESDDNCKDLLCSYYIKNILFWVSEELPLSIWQPGNLISCFMKCFERLLYCVEYSMCPHYFIPEINMFECKIEGHERQVLLGRLKVLYSRGWRCILLSNQLSKYRQISHNRFSASDERVECIKHILFTKAVGLTLDKSIGIFRFCQSPKLQLYLHYFMSMGYNEAAQQISVGGRNRNKTQYNQYRTCLSYLLYNTHHDAVSGWLMLASFYYRIKHYNTALCIVSYAVSKCTTEKFYWQDNLNNEQRALIKTRTIQSMSITRVLKLLLVRLVTFIEKSTLIPEELEFEVENHCRSIPPVVYAHFLRFLCHYHLNNVNQCREELEKFQKTVSKRDFINKSSADISHSYNCLGIAFQIFGNREMAHSSFIQAIKLNTFFNRASERLSMSQRTSTVFDSDV